MSPFSSSPDRLYELLPTLYRQRDAEQGYPLRSLLRVMAEQVNGLEADIDQLYDNWFIETCQDWVVPYIADLIGYRLVHEAGEPGDVRTLQGRQLNKILISRREVANTIRYRRRKGTLALLELLAQDVAGWPARAVEFYKLLAWTQHLNHQRPLQGRTMDLRQGRALAHLDGPFDEWAHTVEVRRISSPLTPGRYNLPSVGLFVWRLKSYSVTHTLAYCLEDVAQHGYTFSVLGDDGPLYTRPQPETDPTHIAERLNLPTPIPRWAFAVPRLPADPSPADGNEYPKASTDYYSEDAAGTSRSLAIWVDGWSDQTPDRPIPASRIIPANLSDWQYEPPEDYVAVDPELGRIAFPSHQIPAGNVWVSYQYGFSADIGGGEYGRSLSARPGPEGLDEDDIKDWAALVEHLRGSSPLSTYVRSRLSDGSQQALASDATSPADPEMQARLLDDLNLVLSRDDLDQSGQFENDPSIPADLQSLLNLHRSHPAQGKELLRLNRRLVEYAYGSAIARYEACYSVGQAGQFPHITGAIAQWEADQPRHAIIELLDSGVYEEQMNGVYVQQISVRLAQNQSLQLRAANRKRPVLRLLDVRVALPDALNVTMESGSQFILDGLLIAGRGVSVRRQPPRRSPPPTQAPAAAADRPSPTPSRPPKLIIRHCTLVPGWHIYPNFKPRKLSERHSLDLSHLEGQVTIEHSIIGSIQVNQDAVQTDPTLIHIHDSIIDATSREIEALGAPGRPVAHARLTLLRSTVIGQVQVHAIDRAEDSILDGRVCVARRQEGCMRFCYVTPESRTPRRYHCQPDLVEQAVRERVLRGELSADDEAEEKAYERLRVCPQFNRLDYGMPPYLQLATSCAEEIQRGASDESEMGVFHDLFQPQRQANLRSRLDDYMPAGMNGGIIFAS